MNQSRVKISFGPRKTPDQQHSGKHNTKVSATWTGLLFMQIWVRYMNYSGAIGGHGVMVSPTVRKTGGHKYGQTALATTIIDDQWVEIVFDKLGNFHFDGNENSRTYSVGTIGSEKAFILSGISLRMESKDKYFSRTDFIALSYR